MFIAEFRFQISDLISDLRILRMPSEPDGSTNVQPSSLPGKLPRMRRGM